MPLLSQQTRRIWNRQPQTAARVDRRNPFTSGLAFLTRWPGLVISDAAGSADIFTETAGGPAPKVAAQGRAAIASGAGTNTGYSATRNLLAVTGTGDFSCLFVVSADALTTQILIGDTAGSTLFGMSGSSWNSWIGTAAVAEATAGQYRRVLWTRKAGVIYVYVDNDVASGSSSAAIPSGGVTTLLCRANAGDYPWSGGLAMFACWPQRGFGPAEANRLLPNPWQLYAPRIARHYRLLAGSGGAVLATSAFAATVGAAALTARSILAGGGLACCAGWAVLTANGAGVVLASAAATVAVGAAALTANSVLSSLPSAAQAIGAGVVTARSILTGGGLANVTGSAVLTTTGAGAALAGAASVSAVGAAALTAQSLLASPAGAMQAIGSGALTTGTSGAVLASTGGTAQASASATLTARAALASVLAIAQAQASAALAVRSMLAGQGALLVSGAGALSFGEAGVFTEFGRHRIGARQLRQQGVRIGPSSLASRAPRIGNKDT